MSGTLDRLKVVLADRYAIQRELGAGGMATVYLAEDLTHRRKVALKVLRPDLAATLGPERFIREITVAANLQHPHAQGRRSGQHGVVALIGLAAALFRPRAEAPLTFGQTVQVTLEPGLEMYPALPPDGRTVAYVAGPIGSQRVIVKSVTGGTAVQVTREPQGNHVLPRWSPDGSQIVFHANGAIYVVPALGGTPRRLASATDSSGRPYLDRGQAYATWSPTGEEIAYVEGTLAVRQMAGLYRRRLDGGEPRLITQGGS